MKILVICNPLGTDVQTTTDDAAKYGSLRDVVTQYNRLVVPCEVRLNGSAISPKNWGIPVYQHDHVVIRPRIMFFIPLPAWTLVVAGTAVKFGVSMVLAYAASRVVTAIFGKKQPDESSLSMRESNFWNPVTTAIEGTRIPKVYGRTKLAGNIINSWTSTDEAAHDVAYEYAKFFGASTSFDYGDDEALNMVIGLADGPCKGIVADSIRINDQPITAFSDVSYEEKKGTLEQTTFTGMTETLVESRCLLPVTVADGAVTYDVPFSGMDDLEIILLLPKGLCYITEKGHQRYAYCRYALEISETGSGIWNTLVDDHVVNHTLKPFYLRFRASGTYDGGAPIAIDRTKHYTMRITKTGQDSSSVYYTDLVVSAVRPVYATAMRYPLTACILLEAVATSKLSGDMEFSCVYDGAIVNTYDGSAWTLQWSDNPAWAILDILTRPVISGDGDGTAYAIERYSGMDPSDIDLDALYTVAQFCDELVPDGAGGTHKRFTCNGIFQDSGPADVWRAVLDICEGIRVAPIPSGERIGFIIDKEGTPAQLFSVGNIVENSLVHTYLDTTTRADVIEVTYKDENQNYEPATLSCVDSTLGNEDPTQLELHYCARQAEAWRYGQYNVLKNRYVKQSVQFGAAIDSVACELGDLFYFQHGTLLASSMSGGRVVSATANTITVDRDDISIAGSLKVLVRVYNPATGDWTLEDQAVSSVVDNVITLTGTWTITPNKNNPFIIGTSASYKQEYRLVRISRSADDTVTLEGIQYHASVYDMDAATPDIQFSGSQTTATSKKNVPVPTVDQVNTLTPPGGYSSNSDSRAIPGCIAWTNNSPGAGSIAWSTTEAEAPIVVTYLDEEYPVADGNTDKKYVYWSTGDSDAFLGTDSFATATAAGCWIMAVNDGGTAIPVWAQQQLPGDVMQDASIDPAKLNTSGTSATYTNIASLTTSGGIVTAGTSGTAITLRQDAAADYSLASFTRDGAYHDLDLSSILPAGATMFWCSIAVQADTAPDKSFSLRENGHTGASDTHTISTQYVSAGGAVVNRCDLGPIGVDGSRVCEYMATNESGFTWLAIDMTITAYK